MQQNQITQKRSRRKDHNLCFYGCEFDSKNPDATGIKKAIEMFLHNENHRIKLCPIVQPNQWMWHGLKTAMDRCAFCLFECVTGNRNAHIELGYALANNLRAAVLVRDDKEGTNDLTKWLPSDLAGLVQIRFKSADNLADELQRNLPTTWYRTDYRLRELILSATPIERTYLADLLGLRPKQTVIFSNLACAPSLQGIAVGGAANLYVSEFLNRFDEVLDILELSPPDLGDQAYDAWQPSWPDKNLDLLNISLDPNYREFVANALGNRSSS